MTNLTCCSADEMTMQTCCCRPDDKLLVVRCHHSRKDRSIEGQGYSGRDHEHQYWHENSWLWPQIFYFTFVNFMYISRVKGTSQTDSSSQVFQTALSLSSLWMDGWIHYRVLELSVVWRVEDLWRQIDAPPTTDRQLIQTEEATKRLEHSKGNQLKICPPFLVCIYFLQRFWC